MGLSVQSRSNSTDEPVFHSIEGALRSTYNLRTRDFGGCVSRDPREAGRTDPRYSSNPWQDAVVNTSYVWKLIQALPPLKRYLLDAYYIWPTTHDWLARKTEAVGWTALDLSEISPAPVAFVRDVVREWADRRDLRSRERAYVIDYNYWERQAGVSLRTLQRWRYGRRDRRVVGILPELDHRLARVKSDLRPGLKDFLEA